MTQSLHYPMLCPMHVLYIATSSSESLSGTTTESSTMAVCGRERDSSKAVHPAWKMAMEEVMSALISRGTWELVDVPPNADVIVCRCVFTLKFRSNGALDRYKARLVA
ncbi:UNVERIFIED_CONTAM: hypothetical protein Scaly_2875200 [Sesamum calycinum]|uniref:Uncharacterized protein n=1 Tax=Sesamum calycinum TaxID=2727403 RepID=A0AAW2L9Y0_9LAMI